MWRDREKNEIEREGGIWVRSIEKERQKASKKFKNLARKLVSEGTPNLPRRTFGFESDESKNANHAFPFILTMTARNR